MQVAKMMDQEMPTGGKLENVCLEDGELYASIILLSVQKGSPKKQ